MDAVGCTGAVLLGLLLVAVVVVIRGLLGYLAGCCVTWVVEVDPAMVPKIRWGCALAFIFVPMLLGGRSSSN